MTTVLNTRATDTASQSIERLQQVYTPTKKRYRPEDSPFRTLFADITHRCNMTCHNCYIPVRDLPDMPVDWLYGVLERLPRRTRIRLVGAEPTMREDLPEIIAQVRDLGHTPITLTNGLKLGRLSYVKKLKAAGLSTIYLSLNGGLRDDLYLAIDNLACADRKLKALDNILAARLYVSTGMILVPGINDGHLVEFLPYLLKKGVHDMHFRSVGKMGRHMPDSSYSLDELEQCVRRALPADAPPLELIEEISTSRNYRLGRAILQLTAWPELGSLYRGRIAPDGFVEPMFESIITNEFRY